MVKSIALTGLAIISGMMVSQQAIAQNTLDGRIGTITTGVPFLRIGPDARSGAMGDVGIAISPDANAQYWNVGKLAASEKDMGFSINYNPWLKELVPDMFLGYLAGYKKFGENDNQAISASLRYFNLGNIDWRDIVGNPVGTGKPREMSFDVGYSRLLSENLSVGVALRYINSNIASGASGVDGAIKPANSFAGDIGVYYTSTQDISESQAGTFSAGAVLSNIGGKVTYSQTTKDFLPTNLGIGVAYTYKVDDYNKITGALDLNKTLAPAPRQVINGTDTTWEIPNYTVVTGMLNSFTEAPKGYGTSVSVGAEYWYQDQFALRAGYFYEHPDNGNRQFFTCGVGVKYMVFGLNFSYLVPSGSGIARNPLANTLRFSLTFDFDKYAIAKKTS